MQNKKITTAQWFWRNFGLMLLVFFIAFPVLAIVLARMDLPLIAYAVSIVGILITSFSAVRISANYVQLRLSDSIEASKVKMIRNWFDQFLNNYKIKE